MVDRDAGFGPPIGPSVRCSQQARYGQQGPARPVARKIGRMCRLGTQIWRMTSFTLAPVECDPPTLPTLSRPCTCKPRPGSGDPPDRPPRIIAGSLRGSSLSSSLLLIDKLSPSRRKPSARCDLPVSLDASYATSASLQSSLGCSGRAQPPARSFMSACRLTLAACSRLLLICGRPILCNS